MTQVDMADVIFVGMSIGYTEEQVARMYYWKLSRLAKLYRKHHNMLTKRLIYKEA